MSLSALFKHLNHGIYALLANECSDFRLLGGQQADTFGNQVEGLPGIVLQTTRLELQLDGRATRFNDLYIHLDYLFLAEVDGAAKFHFLIGVLGKGLGIGGNQVALKSIDKGITLLFGGLLQILAITL